MSQTDTQRVAKSEHKTRFSSDFPDTQTKEGVNYPFLQKPLFPKCACVQNGKTLSSIYNLLCSHEKKILVQTLNNLWINN